MVLLGMANSRMKDYFNIWMLSQSFVIEGAVLREAIRQTFTTRQTALPETEPIGLSDVFSSNMSKRRQWQGFVRGQRKQDSLPDLPEIVVTIRGFLILVITEIYTATSAAMIWKPKRGWILSHVD